MKQFAQRYIYWKGIDKVKLMESCETFAHIKFNAKKAPLHP